MNLQIGDVGIEVGEMDSMFWGLIPELLGPYQLDTIPFKDGDVVLDIGAHKGILAIYMAKRWPGLRIFSFEPEPINFRALEENLKLNKIRNVKAYEQAVTADGREFPMLYGGHSAEASGFYRDGALPSFVAKSTTIKAILGRHRIKQVKLLKLDCEGAEHEILADSDGWADKVEYIRGEIHMIPTLAAEGYTIGDAIQHFPPERSAWQVIENPRLLGS